MEKKYVGKYDKSEAFLALIQILEIEGDNVLINELQEATIRTFKNEYGDSSLNIDWLIPLVIQARKEAVEAVCNK
ncbi:MAG: hypothetical protein KDC70_00110 [Saprospiraceae bacterium]|nr:hypothetical protein [Saprospiraceae bacterium]